jgi:hypothetical protein
MALDTTRVGQVVAQQMEALESQFGDDRRVGDVCTIIEVVGPLGSQVAVGTSPMRRHALVGLLRVAEAMALREIASEPADVPDDDAGCA